MYRVRSARYVQHGSTLGPSLPHRLGVLCCRLHRPESRARNTSPYQTIVCSIYWWERQQRCSIQQFFTTHKSIPSSNVQGLYVGRLEKHVPEPFSVKHPTKHIQTMRCRDALGLLGLSLLARSVNAYDCRVVERTSTTNSGECATSELDVPLAAPNMGEAIVISRLPVQMYLRTYISNSSYLCLLPVHAAVL